MLNVLLPGFGVVDSRIIAGIRISKKNEGDTITHGTILFKDGDKLKPWPVELTDEEATKLHEISMQIYQYGYAKYGFARKLHDLRNELVEEGRCPECGCTMEVCENEQEEEEGLTLEEVLNSLPNHEHNCSECPRRNSCPIRPFKESLAGNTEPESEEDTTIQHPLFMRGKKIRFPQGDGIMFRVGRTGKPQSLDDILSMLFASAASRRK